MAALIRFTFMQRSMSDGESIQSRLCWFVWISSQYPKHFCFTLLNSNLIIFAVPWKQHARLLRGWFQSKVIRPPDKINYSSGATNPFHVIYSARWQVGTLPGISARTRACNIFVLMFLQPYYPLVVIVTSTYIICEILHYSNITLQSWLLKSPTVSVLGQPGQTARWELASDSEPSGLLPLKFLVVISEM